MKYGKAVTLILVGLPVLALGQAPQAKPSQPAATAPAQQPQPAASPNSKRFVTSENFYRATPKPQPGSTAPTNSQPTSAAPAYNSTTTPATQPNAIPVPQVQPAVMDSAPGVVRIPQQVQAPVATMDQNSSAAVDYTSGKLTIVADHAPLGSVLKLIAAKTGAAVDLAPELQNEPVVARLGPDSVRDVLSGLLDSPRIDYIVFGTGDEPGSLQRIVVRRRNSFGQMAAFRPQPGAPQQQLDPDGNPIPASNFAEAQMTPEQRMENWQKTREQMLQAEIKQQAEEREREKTQPAEQPAPQDSQQQDNPPL